MQIFNKFKFGKFQFFRAAVVFNVVNLASNFVYAFLVSRQATVKHSFVNFYHNNCGLKVNLHTKLLYAILFNVL